MHALTYMLTLSYTICLCVSHLVTVAHVSPPPIRIHAQLGEACRGGGGRIRRIGGTRGVRTWPMESIDRDSWGPEEIREPVGSDAGPLHVCYDCIAWCACRIPNRESTDCH